MFKLLIVQKIWLDIIRASALSSRLCPKLPPNHLSAARAPFRVSSAARPHASCRGCLTLDHVTGDLRVLVGKPDEPIETVKT